MVGRKTHEEDRTVGIRDPEKEGRERVVMTGQSKEVLDRGDDEFHRRSEEYRIGRVYSLFDSQFH